MGVAGSGGNALGAAPFGHSALAQVATAKLSSGSLPPRGGDTRALSPAPHPAPPLPPLPQRTTPKGTGELPAPTTLKKIKQVNKWSRGHDSSSHTPGILTGSCSILLSSLPRCSKPTASVFTGASSVADKVVYVLITSIPSPIHRMICREQSLG